MGAILIIVGIIVFIISVATGLTTGSFYGFFIWTSVGATITTLLFSMFQIMRNQEKILHSFAQSGEILRNNHIINKQCQNCKYEYGLLLNFCPNCGYRDGRK
ncbi:heme exporter protein CcmD [Metabacillus malikii]|uniref:Heme exporter protein D n=1 Tax=Metabacillus malikii TaxID=1504265 RepID=A0ABT9ZAN2_9BACI|nr:heme exporter protein CcmD [Metabacillus malikii]MDQ0229306.1 heme exporter protein D [Metabacillus malikii]